MSYNIAQTLASVAAKYPERTGLIVPSAKKDFAWTFRDLIENASFFANVLVEGGVKKGDRVILMVRPSMEFVCLTFALFQIGAVVILIDPGMGYKNLLQCIGSTQPDIFIGIPKALLFRHLFRKPFKTVRLSFCLGRVCRPLAKSLASCVTDTPHSFTAVNADRDELAAIIFTTGSTGPPKGVQYTHGIFSAQLQHISNYYRITSYDRDQPAFPLFALFSTALGACAVIPDMDPTRPAQVDPQKFIHSIQKHHVTYSFGSPAIWNVVSRYCLENNIKLGLKKVLMAGAPVSGELIERVQKIIAPDGEIHTPYGATESLPIASITGSEILADTWQQSRKGKGTCVGTALPGIDIRIMLPQDSAVRSFQDVELLDPYTIGEIIVKGDVVTRAYDNNDSENKLAKIPDGALFWHRMGDMGYLDDEYRLWFCGRKAHRVITKNEILYTICCEAIFNEHPQVFRSALVGIGPKNNKIPVLIVEPYDKISNTSRLFSELASLAGANPLTKNINRFLTHPSFPVDIRHNAKIFREKLAVWAEQIYNKES